MGYKQSREYENRQDITNGDINYIRMDEKDYYTMNMDDVPKLHSWLVLSFCLSYY